MAFQQRQKLDDLIEEMYYVQSPDIIAETEILSALAESIEEMKAAEASNGTPRIPERRNYINKLMAALGALNLANRVTQIIENGSSIFHDVPKLREMLQTSGLRLEMAKWLADYFASELRWSQEELLSIRMATQCSLLDAVFQQQISTSLQKQND